MLSDAPPTRRELLAEVAALLAAGGIAESRREALRLWTDLQGRSAAEVLLDGHLGDESGSAELLRQAARRRAAGEPLAHVVGSAGFRTLTLASDGRALIPRPETEGLVDLVLARVRTGRVADIGTGSGCLALSLASEGEYSEVCGVDSSAAALALAAENLAVVGGRVRLVRGDLCEHLRTASLDAMVSNPPYLSDAEYASLDPSVRRWEPAAALVSGPDGLDATTRLLRESRRVLRAGGWLAMEVDCTRAERVAAAAGALGWMDVAIHADLFGRERYLLARRSASP